VKRCMAVLLVDALGHRLLEQTPGLRDRFPHRRRLETILGFSSGALPTLFSGRLPDSHGRWLMYRRAGTGVAGDRRRSPFSGFEALALVPPRIARGPRLSRLLSRVVARRGVRGYFHLYDVPRTMLPAFDLPERDDVFAPGGLPVESIWDTLDRRGVRWRGWNWRVPEEQSLAETLAAVGGGDTLLFCYTAELDAALHREGSRGPTVRSRLERYGAWVDQVEQAARARGVELWLYLLSDHGMVDVTSTADVMGALGARGIAWPRDVLAFFDSTLARFWWRGAAARDTVRGTLAALPGGRWLTAAERAAAGVAFPDHDYGEDVWLADPGVLIVPSFMGRDAVAAMHGYDPSHPDMAAVLASNRPLPPGVAHLKDVRAFLESELDALAVAA